jgi:RimJ/RimL family protein N-acetyltransferase
LGEDDEDKIDAMPTTARNINDGIAGTVRLRDVETADLPALFQIQLDPEGNRMAAVIPRDEATFHAHWTKILAERSVVAKTILAEEVLVGSISCFKRDGKDFVGYWLAKEHWGKGIASRALALLLEQVSIRPLHARVARDNVASLRVLERSGFEITGYRISPPDGRLLEVEEAMLLLK